jgi:C1A family cysteine protease
LFFFDQQTFDIKFSSEQEKKQAAVILAKANESITKNNELFEKGEGNFLSKLYEFSHLTYAARFQNWLGLIKERKNLNSLDNPTRVKRSTTFVSDVDLPIECANIPDAINWAEKQKTCPVQNQGGCGCCYIFSAIAAVEAAVSIEYNSVPVKLSAQHSLECMKNFTNGMTPGCDGGNTPKVWNFGKQQGGFVAASLHSAYNAKADGQCVALKRDSKTNLDHWESIPSRNEKAMKCRLALNGPISISIAVGDSSIMNYEQGVWDDPDNECQGIPNDHVSHNSSTKEKI